MSLAADFPDIEIAPIVVPPAVARTDEVELTILMPCLNEAETIAACVRKAMRYLERADITGEVVVADNGSTDGSPDIARTLGARVVEVAERGYGAALLGGIEAARGRYVIMGDADDSYDFSALHDFVAALRTGTDLVMGNRFAGGIAPGAMPLLHRYLGNPVLSAIGRLFFRVPVGDFHCGLRGFRREAVERLGLRATGMEFASEMVVKSALHGLSVAEVPTTLGPDGRSRAPHLRTWRDGWRHLKFLLIHCPRWAFLVPGLVFLSAGLFVAAMLFANPVWIGSVRLDINTFVGACFSAVVGAQILGLGAISRQYAAITGFLPRSRSSDALSKVVSTDALALLALVMMVVGLAMLFAAFAFWSAADFGMITNPVVTRAVIAGLAIVVIGVQTLFTALLVGALMIPHRRL